MAAAAWHGAQQQAYQATLSSANDNLAHYTATASRNSCRCFACGCLWHIPRGYAAPLRAHCACTAPYAHRAMPARLYRHAALYASRIARGRRLPHGAHQRGRLTQYLAYKKNKFSWIHAFACTAMYAHAFAPAGAVPLLQLSPPAAGSSHHIARGDFGIFASATGVAAQRASTYFAVSRASHAVRRTTSLNARSFAPTPPPRSNDAGEAS